MFPISYDREDRRLMGLISDTKDYSNILQNMNRISTVESTDGGEFVDSVTTLMKDGWRLSQDVQIYHNGGRTKFVAILGKVV